MADGKPEKGEGLAGGENLPAMVGRSVSRHAMFKPGQSLLVAVSGGADSTAMLHVLMELSTEMALRLGVAHLDHGLRGQDAAADTEFVASLAAGYRLPFFAEKADTRAYARRQRLSLEEAGRKLRYRFLLRTADRYGYDRVAVGHHREDNAETILMGLLRGSGATGLGGIAAVRADGIVRPMIDLSRKEIRDYLTIRGLSFVSDATNSDIQLLRNRVRLELMPLLAADFNPNIVATLNRIGDILQQEDQWLDDLSRKNFEDTLELREEGQLALSLARFNRMHAAARRRIIRLALAAVHGSLRRIGHVHVTAVLQLACKEIDCGPLHLPLGIRVRVTGDRLEILDPQRLSAGAEDIIFRHADVPPFYYEMTAPGTLTITQTGEVIRIDPFELGALPDLTAVPPETAYFDADCLKFPLTVRSMRAGDRFSPLGTQGSQKLKKFFCDHKIGRQRRRTCPLLLSAGRIVWVAGLRIDNAVKLTAATTRVLKAELILA